MTDTDWQNLILMEVGAGLDGADPAQRAALDKVTPNIALLWSAWAYKAYYPNLQQYYVKRQCISVLLGQLRQSMQKSLGPLSMNLAQKVQNLQEMYKNVQAEIETAEKEARANRGVVSGVMTKTAPIEPSYRKAGTVVSAADPNSPGYFGSPFSDDQGGTVNGWGF